MVYRLENWVCIAIGGKEYFACAEAYAFGEQGRDGNDGFHMIPPSSVLHVDLELVSFKPVIDVYGDSKVFKKILREGEGTVTADEGATQMEPQLFNLKFQLFGIDCEMRNVDLDEFSYIVLIKDMKKCVVEENEALQLNLNKKFKQYGFEGLKDVRLYVEALPVQLGNVDGEAGDNDGGDGREEKAETSDNKGEVGAETRGYLSDYEKNSDLGDFGGWGSEDEDAVSSSHAVVAIMDEVTAVCMRGQDDVLRLRTQDGVVTNPGSMIELRHFIGIDGCHLKGHYGGVLLSVVSIDANSGIFPLAICVCEAENNDSWGFFLGLLHDFLGDLEHVTFMSDRLKGILNALEVKWLNARNRFCARHVYANFRKKFPGVHMRKLFWAVSKAANKPDFVKAMGSVKDVDEGANKWLLENELDQWSKHAFDTTTKLDHITNNMSECFNSWLGEDRELPILSLLELYRCREMKRLQCKLKAGTKWITPLPPVVHRKINKMIEAARNVKQLCDYGMWQLSGIPCVHAIACLLHKNISNYEHYVDPKLRIPMYLQTYAYMVHPVPDKTSWPEVSDEYIWPPYKQPKISRPSKSRRRYPNEEPKCKRVSTLRCNVCSVLRHKKANLCVYNDCTLFRSSICSKLVPSFKFKGSTKSIMQWGSSFVCCSSSVSNMLLSQLNVFLPPGPLTQQLRRIVELWESDETPDVLEWVGILSWRDSEWDKKEPVRIGEDIQKSEEWKIGEDI
ncbi:hypothetical protein Pint_07722 [Pistacia integerrima]|uniref:Uncharacterized protein n=1 Tax=Pistacia integerrima TaxID=434235 RepID=A0ACC0XYH6_9ROSI|nr:hypothetical protein Pint_07722 [Pistacia integerrima]